MCHQNPALVKIGQKYQKFYMKTKILFIFFRWHKIIIKALLTVMRSAEMQTAIVTSSSLTGTYVD
jgi:hypothetical protein